MDVIYLSKEFLKFLKRPVGTTLKESNFENKIWVFSLSLILMFFVVIGASIFSRFILYLIDFEYAKQVLIVQKNNLFKYGVFENVSYILIIGPIIEEIIFRLPLKVKKLNIAISLTLAIMILLGGGLFTISIYSTQTYVKFTGLFFCLVLLYFVKKAFLNKIEHKYYRFYFYLMAVLFAMIHIGNFQETALSLKYIWLIPLLILPQFIMGIFFGYIRLKNGFLWGIAMHALTNTPAVILYLMRI